MLLAGTVRPLVASLALLCGVAACGGAPPAPPLEAYGSWRGEPGGPGIHGWARGREWDLVTSVEAPELRGDRIGFVALADGTLVTDDDVPDEPDGALSPVADAVERVLAPPYRAAAVRHDETLWGVGAVRIRLVQLPSLDGDQAELISNGSDPVLTVDGRSVRTRVRQLEEVGEREGEEYVVRCVRVDGDLWQVDALAL